MRVNVDRTLCEANGVCVGLAPGVFSLDAEEVLRIRQPDEESVERVARAVEKCPKGALAVERD